MPRIRLPVAGEYAPDSGSTRPHFRAICSSCCSRRQRPPRHCWPRPPSRAQSVATPKGKWSVKEVVGHLSDGERVFSYRALRFARADATDLPGFEENEWVANANFDRRTLASLAAEFATVRAATLALFASLDGEELLRRGTANGQAVSVRALAALLVGHERHHVGLLRERYGLTG
jgi:hypothetical protein